MLKFIISFLSLLCYTGVIAELNLKLPDLGLPNIGTQAPSFIVSSAEKKVGLKILRSLRASNQIIEDPEINIWIRALGHRLTAHAPQSASPFYFLVSKNLSINAYATAGGVIVVNTGLILSTQTESELAAVISHEIAHITQRHIYRLQQKEKQSTLVNNAALIAGVLASTQDAEAGQAIISTTLATSLHKQLVFSRAAEAEADRVGLRILASAGFNPMGMPLFLAKLERYSDDKNAAIIEYLQNHPLTQKRVSDTLNRAKQFQPSKYKDNVSYAYMQKKVAVISHVKTASFSPSTQRLRQYAQAWRYVRQHQYTRALQSIGKKNNNVHEAILVATLLNAQKKYRESIQRLKPFTQIYPDEVSLLIPLADAYLALGKRQKAFSLLNAINPTEQTSLDYFDALKKVSQASQHLSKAYQATANRNIRVGHYKAAIAQLHQATKLAKIDSQDIYIIEQLLSTLKN